MIIAFELIKKLADGKFHSGQVLAKEMKINRTHLWRAVAYLKLLKLDIYAVTGKGYKLASPIELLNQEAIQKNLSPKTLKALNCLEILSVTKSTNDYLKEYKLRSFLEKTVAVAEAQTQGRGRVGRTWFSPFGANIYLSMYWKFSQNLSGLSLVVGLALAKTLEAFGVAVNIKWPNDIYVDHKKLAGILIESEFKPGADSQNVFIGIGVNVNLRVCDFGEGEENYLLQEKITDLSAILGFIPSRNVLIGEMLNHLVDFFEKFELHGFSYFLPMWEKYDYLLGKFISVIKPNPAQNSQGYAKGITQRGELLLEEQGVLKAICVGDIKVRTLQ